MNDCPDGRMSKEKMKEMFATTVAKSKVISFWSSWNLHQLEISQKMLLWNVVLENIAGQLGRPVCRTIVPSLWQRWWRWHRLQGCHLWQSFSLDYHLWQSFILSRSSLLQPTCANPATQRRNLGDNIGSSYQPSLLSDYVTRIPGKTITYVPFSCRWAFRMYDQDGSGEITPDEMVEIFSLMYAVQVYWGGTVLVSTIYIVTNTQGCTEGDGKAQAKRVFEALDIDKDGKIGKEEFIKVGQTTIYNEQADANNIHHTFQQSSTSILGMSGEQWSSGDVQSLSWTFLKLNWTWLFRQ